MTTTGSDSDHSPDDSELLEEADGRLRLHKILAHRGVASRRKSEQLIAAGSVTVDGEVVTEPGTRVDPKRQEILVDGRPLPREPETFLFLFYKPKSVVSTLFDPEGRPTLRDYFPGIDPLLHIGRLDFQTEGALLLTNNGDLSQRILHPRFEIPRTYLVKIQGGLSPAHLERMAQGEIRLDGRPVVPLELVLERQTSTNAWYRITLTEGRNREVRRLFETLNYFVLKLVRTAFGPLTLAGLEPGEYRTVTPQETELLLAGTRPKSLPKNLDSRFSRDAPPTSRRTAREVKSVPGRFEKEENTERGESRPAERKQPSGDHPGRREAGFDRPTRPRSADSRRGSFAKPRRTSEGVEEEGRSHRETDRREDRGVRRERTFDKPDRAPRSEDFEWSERPEREKRTTSPEGDSPRRSPGFSPREGRNGRPRTDHHQTHDRDESAPSRPSRRAPQEVDDRPIPRTRKFAGAVRPEKLEQTDRSGRPVRGDRPGRPERAGRTQDWQDRRPSSREERPERPRRESGRDEYAPARPGRRYEEEGGRPERARAERPERTGRTRDWQDRRPSSREERPERPRRESGRGEYAPARPGRRGERAGGRPERTRSERPERTAGNERFSPRARRGEGDYERPRRSEAPRSRSAGPRPASPRNGERQDRSPRNQDEGRRPGAERKPRPSQGREERFERPERSETRTRSSEGFKPRKSGAPSSKPRRSGSGTGPARGPRSSGPGKRGDRR